MQKFVEDISLLPNATPRVPPFLLSLYLSSLSLSTYLIYLHLFLPFLSLFLYLSSLSLSLSLPFVFLSTFLLSI